MFVFIGSIFFQHSESSWAHDSPPLKGKSKKFYFYSSDDSKVPKKIIDTDDSEKEDDKFDENTMKAPKT